MLPPVNDVNIQYRINEEKTFESRIMSRQQLILDNIYGYYTKDIDKFVIIEGLSIK